MRIWPTALLLALSLPLVACRSQPAHDGRPPLTVAQANARAPFLPPLPPVVMEGELREPGDPTIKAAIRSTRPQWPIRFQGAFALGTRCVNTLSCQIPLATMEIQRLKPSRRGPDIYSRARIDAWNGFYITRQFPPPTKIRWQSLDGVERHAEISLEDIFRDRQVLHVVPRDEVGDMPDGGKYQNIPNLLIEVNDRTINVYMRAFISTRHLQEPPNKRSSHRSDLILARQYQY